MRTGRGRLRNTILCEQSRFCVLLDCLLTLDGHEKVDYVLLQRRLDNVIFDDCVAWTQCYGYKIGQGAYEDQSNIVFKNSVVYKGAVGIGIDHKFGSAKVSDVTFYNIEIEHISGLAGNKCSWLDLYIQQPGTAGAGPIEGVKINDIKVNSKGTQGAYIQGYNSANTISEVTLQDIYMLGQTTPAKTFAEMDITHMGFSSNVKIIT